MIKKICTVCLIICTLSLAVSCSASSDDLKGLWMDDNSDIILHIMSNNKASLAIAGEKYDGSYQISHGKLNLKLAKSKENFGSDTVSWDYTLDGDTLTLSRNSSAVKLTRQAV